MKEINTYLSFGGNCRQAMAFYAKCLGGEAHFTPFSSVQGNIPDEIKDLVLHAELGAGATRLMASDAMPGAPPSQGDNFSVCVNCSSEDEIDILFALLGEGGAVRMELHDSFWGARFGMLTDRFGIHWMLNYDKPKEALEMVLEPIEG